MSEEQEDSVRPSDTHPSKYPSTDRAAVLPSAGKSPDLPFEEAIAAFDRASLRADVEAAERERLEVVTRFPLDSWPDMPLERYALGT